MADDTPDHLDRLRNLGPLARTIEPLPGGLVELRRRLRTPRSRLLPLALAFAATCCAMLAIWILRQPSRPEAAPDRSAMRNLLVDRAQLPNPRAVALGLVAPATPVVTGDPRVAASDAVVFYWVSPVEPNPPSAPAHTSE